MPLRASVDVDHVADDEMILDIGPKSIAAVEEALQGAKTLVWTARSAPSSCRLSDAATMQTRQDGRGCYWGGQASNRSRRRRYRLGAERRRRRRPIHLCLDGQRGAFLEWMEGKVLPGVEALRPK